MSYLSNKIGSGGGTGAGPTGATGATGPTGPQGPTGPASGITGSGLNTQITYWTGASTIAGSTAFTWNNATGRFQITNGASPAKRAFIVDGPTFDVAMGDISSGGNNTSLYVGDSSQNIQALGGDGLGRTGAVLDIYTNLSAGNGAIVNMGDVSGLVNSTILSVNDQIQQINMSGNAYRGMRLDFASDLLIFGDVGQSTSGVQNIGSIEIGAGGVFNMWGVDGAGTLSPFFASLGGGDYAWGDVNGVGSTSTLTFFESSGGIWSFNLPDLQFGGIDYHFPIAQGSRGQSLVLQDNVGTLDYENVVRSLFSQTQSVTIANTTTPTSVMGSGQGSLTIPANSAEVGSTYKLRVNGYYVATGTPSVSYKVNILGTNVGSSITNSTFSTGSPFDYSAEFTLVVRTTGASGTAYLTGWVKFDKNDGSSVIYPVNQTSLQTINTTTSQLTDMIVTWSAGVPGNSLTITQVILEQTR